MTRVIAGTLCGAVMLAGCAVVLPKETRYLYGAMGQATQEEVKAALGHPLLATLGPNGEARWIYQIREEEPGNRWTSTGLWCDEYILTFDRHSILRQWTHQSEFHGGEIMPTSCVPGGTVLPDATSGGGRRR